MALAAAGRRDVSRMVAIVALSSVLLTGCGWLAVGGDAVTVTFSNELDQDAFLEITELHPPPMEGAQRQRMIAGPIVVPPGEHQVRLVSPQAEWAVRLRGQDGYFDSNDLHDWTRQVEAGEMGVFRIVINQWGMTAETGPP